MDIIEGINDRSPNSAVLHASQGPPRLFFNPIRLANKLSRLYCTGLPSATRVSPHLDSGRLALTWADELDRAYQLIALQARDPTKGVSSDSQQQTALGRRSTATAVVGAFFAGFPLLVTASLREKDLPGTLWSVQSTL